MKKIITLKSIALVMLLATAFVANAQNEPRTFGRFTLTPNKNGVVNCASTEYNLMRQEKNPKIAKEAQFESWVSKKLNERKFQKSGNTVLTIPVVVHVIYYGSDNIGSGENLSMEQIESQIEVLNEDFRKLTGTNGDDQTGYGVDTMIQFCLAKLDPDNNPTNGVTRDQTTTEKYTSMGDIDILKTFTIWDPEKYLNLWTVAMGGGINDLLGYAQFPDYDIPGLQEPGQNSDYETDGVVINYRNFGSKEKIPSANLAAPYNLGRTATHEIGHYLCLRHIWGDATNCMGTDYCADTPKQNDKSQGCPEDGTETCPDDQPDLFQDYMDYTDDGCMSVFTQDQANRMRVILENAPRRASLVANAITACSGLVGTKDMQLLQGMKVYPNPAQNVLNITVDNGDLPDSYVIYNSIGQLVANAKISTEANLTIDTSAYSNGMYFIKIDKGNESKTIKFIKN